MFNFISLIAIIIGAINWFCIGVFQFDIIAGIFGTQSHFFSRFIYTLIGLLGIWFLIYTLIKKGQLSLLPIKAKKNNENNDESYQNETTSNDNEETTNNGMNATEQSNINLSKNTAIEQNEVDKQNDTISTKSNTTQTKIDSNTTKKQSTKKPRTSNSSKTKEQKM